MAEVSGRRRRRPPSRRAEGSARPAIPVRLAVCLSVVALSAPALPATAAAAGPSTVAAVLASGPPQPPGSPCADPTPPPDANGNPTLIPYDPSAAPLALPPWSDGGGWVNASMYSTIRTGDIDGDGRGEILGRNGSSVEAWTAAPPARRADQPPYSTASPDTWPAAPGQWVMKGTTSPPPAGVTQNEPNAPEGATRAQLSTDPSSPVSAVPGFSDPSRHTTFKLAHVMPTAGDQLLVRAPRFDDSMGTTYPVFTGSFLNVYSFSNGVWSTPLNFISLNDLVTPWFGESPTWGPQGPITELGVFGTPWFEPQYYSSIVTADLDDDGLDEIIVRAADGLHEFYWDGDGFSETVDGTNGGTERLLRDLDGFTRSDLYPTLRVGDFDGDGRDEIAVRSGSGTEYGDGLLTARWVGTKQVGSWQWGPRWNDWSDANGYTQPQQYETITVGDLDGDSRDDLFSMGPNGPTAISIPKGATEFQKMEGTTAPIPATNPGTDWTQPQYYETVQLGDVAGGAADEVLARGADGLHTYTLSGGLGGSFSEILSPITQMSDANGWLDPSKYSTITTAMVTKGDKRVVIGRDKTGLRTFVAPGGGTGSWFQPSITFPAWAGGSDPNSLGDASDAGRVYSYINTQIAYKMNWATPTWPGDPSPPTVPTIRSKFVTGSGVSDWFDIATNIEAVLPSDALNVDRDTYEAVQRTMADWARDVGVVWGLFFANGSGQSIEQALLTALVVGDVSQPVDTIQAYFKPDPHSKLWVWVADLLWGAVGGIPFEAGPNATEDAKSVLSIVKFFLSVGAAGGSAAVTNYAPDGTNKKQGQVDVEAQYVDEMLVSNFCNAISFLYGSADQMATDLGLLTAMAQIIRAQPLEPTYVYPSLVKQLTDQRTIWVYQQFASMSDKGVGWELARASESDRSKVAGPLIDVGSQVYAAHGIGGDCGDSHAKAAMEELINTTGLDEYALAQPTWAFWPSDESHHRDDPNGQVLDGEGTKKMGTGGWRLPQGKSC